jgi:hypothetical protein
MKTEAAYKEEYNALIVGATTSLERAVQVRKNLAKIKPRSRYATGPVFVATVAAHNALKALKTFKGAFERNIGRR